MGREVKRVATDFQWPLEKVWEGYRNPHYQHAHQCAACENGYSPMAHLYYQQWYGYVEFDPVAHGSQLLTPESPSLKRFVEFQVDRSIREAAEGTALERGANGRLSHTGKQCYYTENGRLTREEAILKECYRLLEMWNSQWSHHLNADDVKALVDGDRLADFTRRPLPGIPLEEYIRTRAYYLWLEAGYPEGRADEFWFAAAEEHDGHWLPFWNGIYPTPEEVNACIGGFGHDSLNAHVCIRARCEREGYRVECDVCNGHGRIWQPAEAEKWAEEWEPVEPPAGEGYQIWETVSEGSPISPVFSDPRILAEWMANTPRGADDGTTAEQWLKFIVGPGWSPSGIMVNGVYKSGVSAMVEDEQE